MKSAPTSRLEKLGGAFSNRKPTLEVVSAGHVKSEPTSRVEKLREAFLNRKPTLEIARARIGMRVMEETEGEPMVIRRAKIFAAVCRELPINLDPDELYAGYLSTKAGGTPIAIEGAGPTVDFLLAKPKEQRGYLLSEEDEKELTEKILPYWRGKDGKYARTRYGRVASMGLPEKVIDVNIASFGYPLNVPEGIPKSLFYAKFNEHGHTIPDYNKVLKKGFRGIKEEAEERLAKLDWSDPEAQEKASFLKAAIMSLGAACEVGKRFADKAREMAKTETDTGRKVDLEKIAKVCDRVPANPPSTFHEALQTVWFTYMLQYWETPEATGISMGRQDQYLYPFYEKDIQAGVTDRESAQELLDCFILKLQMISWSTDDGHSYGTCLEYMYNHISVGGYKADGSDATNDLSYMFIEAMKHTRMKDPNFSVMIHPATPEPLLIKACELTAMGVGQPIFENADMMVASFLDRGTLGGPAVTLKDARDGASMGCQDPISPGKGGWHFGGGPFINAPLCLSLVLQNGVHQGKKIGVETGDPRQFKSLDELKEAFLKQLAWVTQCCAVRDNAWELAHSEITPTSFSSALLDDCIEKGKSIEHGGAHYYNSYGGWIAGSADVADSLTTIRKFVFEEKKITLSGLIDALDKNFEGQEDLRQMLLRAPKWGSDDDYADEQMTWIMREWIKIGRQHKNRWGGHWAPGGSQVLFMYPQYGREMGALPSGRLAGEPIANATGPTDGNERIGPTGVINSMGKLNNVEFSQGSVLNMRLSKESVRGEAGVKRLAAMMRAFVDRKAFQVQFNIVSQDTLRAAQKQPDKYKDLLVRVAGYSAYFTSMSKDLQEGVIRREELAN